MVPNGALILTPPPPKKEQQQQQQQPQVTDWSSFPAPQTPWQTPPNLAAGTSALQAWELPYRPRC